MNKRKRAGHDTASTDSNKKILLETAPKLSPNGTSEDFHGQRSIQVITGSYDKVLHGFIATLPSDLGSEASSSDQIEFSDNFLFNAHSSAIRSLAISPPPTHEGHHTSEKLILATGGTDERINLYHLSSCLPDDPTKKLSKSFPALQSQSLQNPKNKELGSLLHHDLSVNVLHFPSRSKLLSAGDDNTIAISRTRDWTVLSTIKAPIPKVAGRPSGDPTAPHGGAPSGVNDFAVHPSQKLMISVGKGERCMRLWNLVTGKKAGVLNFEKELVRSVGESKWSRGEGRKVRWNSRGNEFAVVFERGVVVFGMNSEPKRTIVPEPPTKLHQLHFLECLESDHDTREFIAISSEDGRILIYSSQIDRPDKDLTVTEGTIQPAKCRLIGYLGGRQQGVIGRIKDFVCLETTSPTTHESHAKIFVGAGSDGVVRLWHVKDRDLLDACQAAQPDLLDSNAEALKDGTETEASGMKDGQVSTGSQVGRLLGSYETGNRITCMTAFKLQQARGKPQDQSDGEKEEDEDDEEEEEFEGFDSSSE